MLALARRYQALTTEIAQHDKHLLNLCRQANPALLAAVGFERVRRLTLTFGIAAIYHARKPA